MPELLLGQEVYAIVGAAMDVYNNLGSGFLEAVYQEAFEIELAMRDPPFVAQPELRICYKSQSLRKIYIPDFLVFDRIIVEIKAIEKLSAREEAQLVNYLKATRLEVGILINFCSPHKLEWKRMVYTRH